MSVFCIVAHSVPVVLTCTVSPVKPAIKWCSGETISLQGSSCSNVKLLFLSFDNGLHLDHCHSCIYFPKALQGCNCNAISTGILQLLFETLLTYTHFFFPLGHTWRNPAMSSCTKVQSHWVSLLSVGRTEGSSSLKLLEAASPTRQD